MRLIDADALKHELKVKRDHLDTSTAVGRGEYIASNKAITILDEQPTVDAVPVKVIEQFKWERDTAIQQLEEHGIPFCGKADVVAVVRCKDCINWNGNDCITIFGLYAPRPDDYCSRGEKNSG